MEHAMPLRIMVVADDLNLALLLQYNFEAVGFEVELVEGGHAAERRIAERCPDLLLSDWMLPEVSGMELCRRLRKQAATRFLPIMLLSGRTDSADREFALQMGANILVTRPFLLSDILARARNLLEPRTSEMHAMA